MRRWILMVSIAVLALPCWSLAQQETAKEHFDSAVKYYLNHNFDASLQELNKCLAIDKNYNQANKMLSMVLKRKDEEARQKKKKSLSKEDAALAQQYFDWAIAKYLNNELVAAMEGVNQVLKIDPAGEKANELLGKITQKIEAQHQDDDSILSLANLIPPNKRNDKIKIFFKDEDINVAVQALAQVLGINIIFASDVEGKVNANFIEATPEEVLTTILKSVGATYWIEGSVVQIIKSDNDRPVTKMFRLKHTTLTDEQLAKLRGNLSSGAQVSYETESHTLIITDTYANILNTEELIKGVDVPRKQVLIETKIVEVSVSKSQELGVNWDLSKLSAAVTGAGVPTTFPFSKGNTALREWTPQHTPGTESDYHNSAYGFPYGDAAAWKFGSITTGSLSLALKYIEDHTKSNLLSSPRVLAMDNEESQITIGQNVPVSTYERNSTTGTMEITGYQNLQLGIILKVTPKIHDDGYVTLTLHPQVSDSLVNLSTLAAGTPPITTTREVITTMRIKDGETAVIGGMIKEKDEMIEHKMPFLGDIPIIGWAFKYKNPTKEKVETLIFLTVHVVKEA